jgi:5-(carboxyamino)imidazole ribonucleotide synthase
VGTFALEYFLTSAGELIVNEIAPRVHNSGHYTQNTCAADQFENHWRAVLGLPLGSSHVKSFYAMLNLLGPDIPELLTGEPPLPVAGNRTHLYWYGKAEIRPRRKLGHLNGNVYKKEDVESLFSELERCKQVWISKLLRKVEVCHEKK